jgi:hypothetical protein
LLSHVRKNLVIGVTCPRNCNQKRGFFLEKCSRRSDICCLDVKYFYPITENNDFCRISWDFWIVLWAFLEPSDVFYETSDAFFDLSIPFVHSICPFDLSIPFVHSISRWIRIWRWIRCLLRNFYSTLIRVVQNLYHLCNTSTLCAKSLPFVQYFYPHTTLCNIFTLRCIRYVFLVDVCFRCRRRWFRCLINVESDVCEIFSSPKQNIFIFRDMFSQK